MVYHAHRIWAHEGSQPIAEEQIAALAVAVEQAVPVPRAAAELSARLTARRELGDPARSGADLDALSEPAMTVARAAPARNARRSVPVGATSSSSTQRHEPLPAAF